MPRLFKWGIFFWKWKYVFHSCCSPAIAYSPCYAELHSGLCGAVGFIPVRL